MVKFIFRWAFRLLVLCLVLAAVLLLCKDALVKSWLESRIRVQTGMDAKISRLDIGLFTPTVSLEGIKLFNPSQFGGLPFLDVPDLYLEYDRRAFLRHELHCQLVRVNLAEIDIVQDANGKNGLQRLLAWLTAPKSADQAMQFTGIDTLNLSLGTIKAISLTDPTKSRAVKAGLQNEVVKHLKSSSDLAALVFKTLWPYGKHLGLAATSLKPEPASK